MISSQQLVLGGQPKDENRSVLLTRSQRVELQGLARIEEGTCEAI